jgi:Ca2+-binding EF-hand superfamily protein
MKKLQGNLLIKEAEIKELMNSLDKDGNGVIDYQEFITAAIDKVALLTTKNLTAAFQMLD